MHFIDEGPRDAQLSWVCLHADATWSYSFRHQIPVWLAAGHRVLAPDLLGFGRSDKPKKVASHHWRLHLGLLKEWLDRLQVRHTVLVLPGSAAVLGIGLLPHLKDRVAGVALINAPDNPLSEAWRTATLGWRRWCERHPRQRPTDLLRRAGVALSEGEQRAYLAPFPDPGHGAGLQAFSHILPACATDDGAEDIRQGLALLRGPLQAKVLAFHSQAHPHWRTHPSGNEACAHFAQGALTHRWPEAPHFLLDNGAPLAHECQAFFSC